MFSRQSSRFQDEEEDDEEALRWAALERLPTFDRVRRGILALHGHGDADGGSGGGEKKVAVEVVDVARLGARESRALIERLVRAAADDDHERFLLKLRARMDRVGIDYPTIEVRYENLHVQAQVHVGDRGLPTLINSVTNTIEVCTYTCTHRYLHAYIYYGHALMYIYDEKLLTFMHDRSIHWIGLLFHFSFI